MHPLAGSRLNLEENAGRNSRRSKAQICEGEAGQLLRCHLLLLQRPVPQNPIVGTQKGGEVRIFSRKVERVRPGLAAR